VSLEDSGLNFICFLLTEFYCIMEASTWTYKEWWINILSCWI